MFLEGLDLAGRIVPIRGSLAFGGQGSEVRKQKSGTPKSTLDICG